MRCRPTCFSPDSWLSSNSYTVSINTTVLFGEQCLRDVIGWKAEEIAAILQLVSQSLSPWGERQFWRQTQTIWEKYE